MKKIKLDQVVVDGGTQTRAKLNEDTIAEYAEGMTEGVKFPPVVVFGDGNEYLLADGFHRVMAAERNGWREIEADVRKGSKQDAIKYSLGANVGHGLRRTNADKHRCVEIALQEFGKLSDRAIAQMCGVSSNFVGGVRYLIERGPCPQVSSDDTSNSGKPIESDLLEPPASRIGRDGKTYKPPSRRPVEAEKDPNGKEIPKNLLALWRRRQEIQDMLTQISNIRCRIERGCEEKDKLFAEINQSSCRAHLDQAYTDIKATMPHCVCPYCQGEGCRACCQRGLIGKFRYDNTVTSELKKK
jgi:hypothetical protein